MDKREHLEHLLKVARSDLADCSNPEVLKCWPNLGTEESKKTAQDRIDSLIEQLAGL